MAWRIELGNGIHLPEIGWRLDARFPCPRSFVSHAHFDHMGEHREILCSETTAKLAQARLKKTDRTWTIRAFNEPFEIAPGVRATLYPAGHIAGSAMILLEKDGSTLLYTGDFKLTPGLSAEPCQPPQADIVIMETTYGLPRYTFPPASETIRDIVRFCQDTIENGDTPVLFGYSLGKSQEALQGLADAGLPAMLLPDPFRMTEACREIGLAFPPYALFDEANHAGHVVISPPLPADSPWRKRIRNPKTAMLTGWAVDSGAAYRYHCDKVFPLSDHADFLDLQDFVARVNPSKVYTLHGFAEEFAQTLRAQGYDAQALAKDSQLGLDIKVEERGRRDVRSFISQAFDEAPGTDTGELSFERFASLAANLSQTESRERQAAAIAEYLQPLDTETAANACLFLAGRCFPKTSRKQLTIDWPLIKQAVIQAADSDEIRFKAARKESGDNVEAALALLSPAAPAGKTLREIRVLFDSLALALSPSFQLSLLADTLSKLPSAESRALIRILLGDLKLGLPDGTIEEAIARRFDRPADPIREAHLRGGDLAETVRAAAEDRLFEIQTALFNPLPFMRAESADCGAAADCHWAQDKYDGLRCQVHKSGEHIEFYGKDGQSIGHQFPELVEALRSTAQSFIADGEIIAWREERPLPAAALRERLRRKGEDLFLGEETPALLWLFDLVRIDRHDLFASALRERRAALETLSLDEKIRIAPIHQPSGHVELEFALAGALARGHAGLVLKDPDAPYDLLGNGPPWRVLLGKR